MKHTQLISGFLMLFESIKNKRNELLISVQLVIVFTALIAIFLYLAESGIPNGGFKSYLTTLTWCFSKFVNDIGGYGDFAPVTTTGKFLASIVGLLTIIIFALPAGIITSGFVEELDKLKTQKILDENYNLISNAFDFEVAATTMRIKKQYQLTATPRRKLIVDHIKMHLALSEEEILNTVKISNGLRLSSRGELHLEKFYQNTSYGTNFDKKSGLTIVNTIGKLERGSSHFTNCLRLLTDYNYLSVELFASNAFLPYYNLGFTNNFKKESFGLKAEFDEFSKDLLYYSQQDNIFINILCSKAITVIDSTEVQFHIIPSIKIKSEGSEERILTVKDETKLINMYDDLRSQMNEKYGFNIQLDKYYGNFADSHIHSYIWNVLNSDVITIYVSYDIFNAESNEIYYGSAFILGNILKKHYGKN